MKLINVLLLFCVLILGTGSARAGGWSGGDSSDFRASFNRGHTLQRVYAHLDDR